MQQYLTLSDTAFWHFSSISSIHAPTWFNYSDFALIKYLFLPDGCMLGCDGFLYVNIISPCRHGTSLVL